MSILLAKFIGSFSYLLTCDDENSDTTLIQRMDAKFIETWREMKELSKLRNIETLETRLGTLKKMISLEAEVFMFASWVKYYVFIHQRCQTQTSEIDDIMKEASKLTEEQEKLSKIFTFENSMDRNSGISHFDAQDFQDVKKAIDFGRGLLTKHWEEDWLLNRMRAFSKNMQSIFKDAFSLLDAKKCECERCKRRIER